MSKRDLWLSLTPLIVLFMGVFYIILLWPNLGVGRGFAYQREYTYLSKQHFAEGRFYEAARMFYLGKRWGIQSEISWLRLQDDLDLFDNLVESGRYDEANQICSEVFALFEYGTDERFRSQCSMMRDALFNEMIQFCRELGILYEGDPALNRDEWVESLSYCNEKWEAEHS